jgi:phosphatidylinositol 4-kinase
MVRACTQSRSHGITIHAPGKCPHYPPYAVTKLTVLFKKYLAVNQSLSPIDSVDLGASIAENYGKAIGPVERKLCTCIRSSLFHIFHCCIASLAALSKHKPDRAKIVTSQIASKAYYTGEIAGLRLAGRGG